jgi:hypothetical protein
VFKDVLLKARKTAIKLLYSKDKNRPIARGGLSLTRLESSPARGCALYQIYSIVGRKNSVGIIHGLRFKF